MEPGNDRRGTQRCIDPLPGRWAARVLSLVAAVAGAPLPCSAQSFQAALSRDTVPMGSVFELRVRVPVPPGSAVYFPDTVASTEVLESHTPVRWDAEATPDGGATLLLTYPVIAYGAGLVGVPGFDVFVRPAGRGAGGDGHALPGGSFVAAWSEAPLREGEDVRPLRVPRRGVWVDPVFSEEQLDDGVEPMPSADVTGASWHWPSIAFGLLCVAELAAVAVRTWRSRSPGRRRGLVGRVWTAAECRRDALAQLDRLLEEDLPSSGRIHELYTRSSGIVRRFVGRMDSGLGADLTSSELMGRLAGRTNGSRGSGLFREMGTAEVVKFGRMRPGRADAEAHIRSLREWVESAADRL